MRSRRCLLFMPGDDLKKIQKGISLGVDSIVMDLEDGVALNRKVEARCTTPPIASCFPKSNGLSKSSGSTNNSLGQTSACCRSSKPRVAW